MKLESLTIAHSKMPTRLLKASMLFVSLTAAYAADKPPYTISPQTIYRGQTVDVTVSDAGCPGQIGKLVAGVTAVLPAGPGLTVNNSRTSADHCSLVVNVKVDPKAPLGGLDIRLEQGGQILTVLPSVTVADEPGVDVVWSVISANIMKDNFGHFINNKYLGLDVAIGNHSGYDLLVSSVVLNTKEGGFPMRLLPSSSYKLVRGTLEKEELIGPRALIINTIKALGPIGTGFIPFFHATGPKANFSTGVDIFSNPLEKGLEAVFPDTVVKELDRLDDQYLREGTVIHNADQPKYRVFVPKEFVKRLMEKLVSGGDKFDPHNDVDVARALNELVLVGQSIDYGPRIHVGAPSTTGQSPAPAPTQ